MVTIKKGTYRFKDEVDLSVLTGSYSMDFPFYIHGGLSGLDYNASLRSAYTRISLLYGTLHYNGLRVYTATNKWNDLYNSQGAYGATWGEEIKGHGQTITVLKDTNIVTTGGIALANWFYENTELQSGESETVAAISYWGKLRAVIAKGQTATIPCDDKLMEGDIVISLCDC